MQLTIGKEKQPLEAESQSVRPWHSAECEQCHRLSASRQGLSGHDVSVYVLVVLSRTTLCDPMDLYSWNSPGKNTGAGCHSILQNIFPTQRSNPSLLHCGQLLDHLSHQEALVMKAQDKNKMTVQPFLTTGKA